jgi:YD repeat-containing protein
MLDYDDYVPDYDEPDAVDWSGKVLNVGDRVMYGCWQDGDVIAERCKPLTHDPYAATITWFEWDEDGLHLGITFYSGEKESIHGFSNYARGGNTIEFSDIEKMEE